MDFFWNCLIGLGVIIVGTLIVFVVYLVVEIGKLLLAGGEFIAAWIVRRMTPPPLPPPPAPYVDRRKTGSPFARPHDAFGVAQYGWKDEAAAAGINPENGFLLGMVDYDFSQTHIDGVWREALRYPGQGHRLVVGSPGAGKFTSVIAPLLLDNSADSFFVLDPKNGEATKTTLAYRRSVGTADVLDPFGITGERTAGFNPLVALSVENPRIVEDARAIAKAIIVQTARDPFWDISAEQYLEAFIVHVATAPGHVGKRDLLSVVQLLAALDDKLLKAMRDNPAGEGLVQRAALKLERMIETESRTFTSIIATLEAHLGFIDQPAFRRLLEDPARVGAGAPEPVSFKALKAGTAPHTIFVAVPNEFLDQATGWLRLLFLCAMRAVQAEDRDGLGREVHMVLDELPSLKKFQPVVEALAIARGYRVHLHCIVQDLNQLKAHYGDGWQTFMGNCAVRQFLGVSDSFTAEELSKLIGTTTMAYMTQSWTRSESVNFSTSTSVSGGGGVGNPGSTNFSNSESRNKSQTENMGEAFTSRRLLPPEQAIGMNVAEGILLVRGCASPIRYQKLHYFTDARFMALAGKREALSAAE